MRIIDVDGHIHEPHDWLTEAAPELAAMVPTERPLATLLSALGGELLANLPPDRRPDPLEALGSVLGVSGPMTEEQRDQIEQTVLGILYGQQGVNDVEGRVAYLDDQGIDEQWVLPTFAFSTFALFRREHPELAPTVLGAYNRWMFERFESHGDRVRTVPMIDLRTMDRTTVEAELHRAKERGGRAFAFWPTPVNGKALSHPDFDWLWAVSQDVGIFPYVHVGAGGPTLDLGWFENGRELPSQAASFLLQSHQLPEILLTELAIAGVFERYPRLRIHVAELGIDWFGPFLERADSRLAGASIVGFSAWSLPLKPSEYLRRAVRVTPLHVDPTRQVIDQIGPGSLVFSTDYPHMEGGANARAHYERELAGLEAPIVSGFFGGIVEEDLALC
jgi:uncharacterized protein